MARPQNSVQINLGTLPTGEAAEVVLTNTALSTGIMTNVWSVTTTCNNTNLSNNSAAVQVTVTLQVAVITNGPATLLAQGPPYNGAINSGQTNTVAFTLVNIGTAATTNTLVATLLTNSGIRPVTTKASYGIIAAGRGLAPNRLRLSPVAVPGQPSRLSCHCRREAIPIWGLSSTRS